MDYSKPTFRYGKPVPAFPAREGVLWQPCPYCNAKPGEACVNLNTGTTALNFHPSRPDGYED